VQLGSVRRVLAVLVGLLSLAGCGAEDGLSTEQFAQMANGICVSANERVRMLGPEPPILTADQADWILRLTGIDRSAIDELRRLKPPSAERPAIAAMLASFERGLSRGEAIARASHAADDAAFRRNVAAALDALTRAQTTANRYGLDACAQLGRVVRGR
jgi:hypothetical protein